MRTELMNLKDELVRFTSSTHLKKEFNQFTENVRTFDIRRHLAPATRKKIDRLGKQIRDLVETAREFQKQLDANLDRFTARVRAKDTTRVAKNAKGKKIRKSRRNGRTSATN